MSFNTFYSHFCRSRRFTVDRLSTAVDLHLLSIRLTCLILPFLKNVTSMVPKLISAFKFSCVKKQRLFEYLLLYAESISLSWPFHVSKGSSFPETLNVCWTVLDCSLFPVLSFPLFFWMASDTSEFMSITSLGSPSSLMVSASGWSNFTFRERAILFRSPIHRLDNP